jgi:small multidrug resistance pump
MVWLYLAIAVTAEVIATTALKLSKGFTEPIPSVFVAIGYAGSFFFLTKVLKELPISIAYAIWSGVGVALVSVVGWVWLGHKLDAAAIIGISLIIAGVVVINLFSSSIS